MMPEFSKENFEKLFREKEILKKANQELALLNHLAGIISSTMSLEKVLNRVVLESIKALNSEQGTIHLLNPPGHNQDRQFNTLIRKAHETTFDNEFRLNDMLTGWMLKNRCPLTINDFDNNPLIASENKEDFIFESLLSVPLLCKGQLIGILSLFNKKDGEGFDDDDKRLLSIIATQSAQIIENARLYEEEKHLRQFERELASARAIQSRLLPKESPAIAGFDVAGVSYAAKEVGGDYYDFIALDDTNWCIALGDVSGKGMPAALLMSNLQATLRNQMLNNTELIAAILKTNRFLFLNTDANQFITAFCCVLNTSSQTLTYVNCGHNPPFHLNENKKFKKLNPTGLVLGVFIDSAYEEKSLSLRPGEIIVIYSDGITEAENGKEEMFGEKRLQQVILENSTLNSNQLMRKIYDSVKSFSADAGHDDDDITLIVIKAV